MPDYGAQQPPPPDTVTLGGGAWNDPREGRPSRRWWYVGAAAVGVVALVAGGTVYAASQLRAQHDAGPAAGLPSTTLAYAAIDLDPSAGQKIEALEALRKLPAFTRGMKVDPSVDLRKLMVQGELGKDGCDLDWSKDVSPWLGTDIGGAVVATAHDGPQPVAVVAVKDTAAAKAGLPKLLDCAALPHGLSIRDGWAIVAQNDGIAAGVSRAAKSSALGDDTDFKTWVDRTGDPGVATLYASHEAGTSLGSYLGKAMSQLGAFGTFGDAFGGTSAESASGSGSVAPAAYVAADPTTPGAPGDPADPFSLLFDLCPHPGQGTGSGPGGAGGAPGALLREQQVARFQGGAATLRFSGGGFELESATRSAGTKASAAPDASAGTTDLTTLPGDTAIALGTAVDPDAVDQAITSFAQGFAQECGSTADRVLADAGRLTGLTLPQDISALFGHGGTLSVSGTLDPAAFDSPTVPTHDFPVGVRIQGDADQIAGVLSKLPGASAAQLLATTAGAGQVAVGPDADYRSELLKKGDLGGQSAFKDVVPHADDATSTAFVSFDQLRAIIARDHSADSETRQVVKNLEHLSAFGASTWVQDGISHGLVRIATK